MWNGSLLFKKLKFETVWNVVEFSNLIYSEDVDNFFCSSDSDICASYNSYDSFS